MLDIPRNFILGAATAAYQVEGAVAEGGRGVCIWDTFSHTPGKTLNGETGDIADDHYHRLEEDLDLMKELGLDAYRFSIAWTRIQPTGRGPANPEGLSFYSRLIDGLIARGIKPVATLYHWDLPQALQDEGGWTTRETSYAFAEYARIVGAEFGDRVYMWTTLNEPWCSAFLGYAEGRHAPGHVSELESLRAAHHLNLAHGLAVNALRATVATHALISVTLNLAWSHGTGPRAAEAVRKVDAIANRIFTGPMLNGAYPTDLLEDTKAITDWSFVAEGDLELISKPIDLLGVNYYTTSIVRIWDGVDLTALDEGRVGGPGTAWPGCVDIEFVPRSEPTTAMGWPIIAEGLTELLLDLKEQFPALPLMVTENGAAFPDDADLGGDGKTVHDGIRIAYLRQHLAAVLQAHRLGVNVGGFFVWSLMDNFEWSYGYGPRFGIVRVDYASLERTPKDSAHWFSAVIRHRTL